MELFDCRRPLFACRMIHWSSPAVAVLGWPPQIFLTAVPVVWNAFKARETTLLLIPNFAATLVTIRPSYSFPIILPRVKSSRKKWVLWRSLLNEVQTHQTRIERDEVMDINPDIESKFEKSEEREMFEWNGKFPYAT
ncbi:structural maintenance of chromosomes protein 2-2 [Trichonephila clavipes]|nr:structural maintenance of chromosomes protein 2-2 [Trichonephila clavipes]